MFFETDKNEHIGNIIEIIAKVFQEHIEETDGNKRNGLMDKHEARDDEDSQFLCQLKH